MKNSRSVSLVAAIAIHHVAGAQEIDVSNVITHPRCAIDVSAKLWEVKSQSILPTAATMSRRVPVEVRVSFNNVQIELPVGFTEIFWDASRIVPLRKESACGFEVVRGDGSTSNRLAVYFLNNKIRRVERFDLKGRVVSSTNFNYPGPVVLD